MLIKISKSNTCMAAWMETTESKNVYQICQSSRIIISPIVFINTLYVYWRIGVTGGVSSRSRAAQSKMFIKISESNTYMSEWRQQCSPKEKCFKKSANRILECLNGDDWEQSMMSTKICQSSRIRVSPYCLYHYITCILTDWSDRRRVVAVVQPKEKCW